MADLEERLRAEAPADAEWLRALADRGFINTSGNQRRLPTTTNKRLHKAADHIAALTTRLTTYRTALEGARQRLLNITAQTKDGIYYNGKEGARFFAAQAVEIVDAALEVPAQPEEE